MHRSWSGGSPIPMRRTPPRRGAWVPAGRPATSRRSGTSSSSWWPPAPPMRRPSGRWTPRKAPARMGRLLPGTRAARTGSPPTTSARPLVPSDPGGLTTAFGSWYSTFSTYGKPLLISNTGVAPGSQGQFLRQVAADLPTRYPLIKALVYFDAPQEAAQTQLALDGDGQAAFRALSERPYFQPTRSPSATTVTAPVTHVTEGQPVSITGSVDVPDHGGSVTYLSNGSALAGCSDLPVTRSVDCDTSALPVGTDGIVAAYSGDAAFAALGLHPPVGGRGGAVAAAPVRGPAAPAPRPQRSGRPTPAHCDSARSGPGPGAAPTGPVHKPVVPGPCQTYLGASVDPNGTTRLCGTRRPQPGRGPPGVDRPTGSDVERAVQRHPARGRCSPRAPSP